jgi:predicted NUDIX family NTP pyrophosphohydrolase
MGMPRISAGILLFRRRDETAAAALQVLLVHPGGPFWKNKDAGAWSIPKGEVGEGEDLLATARREFEEELGVPPPGMMVPLGSIKQKSGKVVHAWAGEGECDVGSVKSNTFRLEWPPKSGQWAEFPEVDRAGWFTLSEARIKLNPAQAGFLEELERVLAER